MEPIAKALDTMCPQSRLVLPQATCICENCEMRVHIGIFFDGTGNNRYADEPVKRDSNVAMLFRAYPDRPLEGFLRNYLPGVGTPFPQIGEVEADRFGMGFGGGGEGRIVYGLLSVFNSIHRAFNNDVLLFSDHELTALSRNGKRRTHVNPRTGDVQYSPVSAADEAALRSLNMVETGGLISEGASDGERRRQFFI